MTRLGAQDWIGAAFACLSAGGIDEVRVEALARTLKVSKGSFYWHFEDRNALLAAMLDEWERQGTEAIINEVEATATAPRERLTALIRRVFGEAHRGGIEVGLRAWARRSESARNALERVDARRLDYVSSLLQQADIPDAEAARRSALLYRTLIGEMALVGHGTPKLEGDALASLTTLLLTPQSGCSS